MTKTYFRYYVADGGTPAGFQHGLRYVAGPEGCARLAAAGYTDPDTAGDSVLDGKADHYFEFDDATNKRVTTEIVNGQGSINDAGSSSTASRSTYGYTYATSSHADGFNNWKTKTVETRPDGHKLTVYCNYAGQPMLKVLEEYSGGSPTGAKWYEYFKYDSQGRLIQRGTSEAVASYSEASPGLVTLNSSVGLIHVYDYYGSSSTTGWAPGRLQFEKVKQGNTGSEVKVREWQYTPARRAARPSIRFGSALNTGATLPGARAQPQPLTNTRGSPTRSGWTSEPRLGRSSRRRNMAQTRPKAGLNASTNTDVSTG